MAADEEILSIYLSDLICFPNDVAAAVAVQHFPQIAVASCAASTSSPKPSTFWRLSEMES